MAVVSARWFALLAGLLSGASEGQTPILDSDGLLYCVTLCKDGDLDRPVVVEGRVRV